MELAKPAIAAVREGKTKFVPQNWEKTYFDWMENIQPWCISRQLWWGHQIPAGMGRIKEKMALGYPIARPEDAYKIVCASESEATATATEYYKGPVEAVADLNEAIARTKIDNKKFYIWRDGDVLDTWFSSALWPFSTLGWPGKEPKSWLGKVCFAIVHKMPFENIREWLLSFFRPVELKRFYPTSTLVTGFDIIFFWVARMMMMGLHFMKEVPFHDVYIHRLVRDATGAKMSKSKGNVVDPLGVIDQYGADALALHVGARRGAGPRHQARAAGRREQPQFRDQALERRALCRDERLRRRSTGFDPRSRQGNAQPLDRARDGQGRRRGAPKRS